MSARVQRSPQWDRAFANMQNLPKAYENEIRAGTREHVEGVRKVLEEGIRKNNLTQPKLSSGTHAIRRGLRRSYSQSTFVGEKGDMIASMQVFELNRGFGLQPVGFASQTSPSGKVSRISWAQVWSIHENGCLIPVTTKMRGAFAGWFGINLKASTTQIRIPARHPLQKAVNRYLRSEAKKKINRQIADRIRVWIVKGI